MPKARILVFAGSTRTESYNKKLAHVAVKSIEAAGGEATFLDLRDIALPLFDEDLEAASGQPEGSTKLKALMKSHDGFFISSPEYNSSISGVLKNAIDWASREVPDEKSLECFAGKVAALVAASPGALGGLRGLVTVRSILGNLQVLMLPDQLAVGKAFDAFNPDGSLKSEQQKKTLDKIASKLVDTIEKLKV